MTCSTRGIGSWRKRSPSALELLGRPRREKARLAVPGWVVLDALARQRLGHLAGGLVRREDQRRPAPEGALEHAPDHRVVRAAEDDRVDVLLLERRRVLAHGRVELLPDDARLDQRHELRARDRDDAARRRRARARSPRSGRSPRSPRWRAGRSAGSASPAPPRAPRGRARRRSARAAPPAAPAARRTWPRCRPRRSALRPPARGTTRSRARSAGSHACGRGPYGQRAPSPR